MNNFDEREIHYRLLKILAEQPRITQRDMARRMGISLGKVNYCLSQLADKGLIMINRFMSSSTKLPYAYLLTPRGLEEKRKLAVRFLKRKLSEYEETKRQIEALSHEMEKDNLENIYLIEQSKALKRAL